MRAWKIGAAGWIRDSTSSVSGEGAPRSTRVKTMASARRSAAIGSRSRPPGGSFPPPKGSRESSRSRGVACYLSGHSARPARGRRAAPAGSQDPVDFHFANVAIFTVVAAAFVVANLGLAMLLRPKSGKNPAKLAIYECGEPTIGQAWIRFDIRFYTVALMFVVFDVEVALLFPWGAIFRDLVDQGLGGMAFVEVAAFLLITSSGTERRGWQVTKHDPVWDAVLFRVPPERRQPEPWRSHRSR